MQQTQLPTSQCNSPFKVLIQSLTYYPLRRHQQLPSCTGDYFPAAATTTPAPATTFLQQWPISCTSSYQQLSVLNQRPPSCTSKYKQLPFLNQRPPSCTSRYQSCTSDYLPASAETSPAPATTYSTTTSLVPATTCSNDQHPAAVTVCHTLFRFTIRHNKVWPFEATPSFCHSCLVRCQSIIFQKFAGTGIFIWPPQHLNSIGAGRLGKLH